MWADIGHQLHHSLAAGELDLLDGECAGGVELRGLGLESVQSKELEQAVHNTDRGGVQLVRKGLGLQSIVKVLDNEVLGVCGGQAPEVDEEGVPRLLLDVTVLECLEGEVGSPPCESGNDVAVGGEDVECTALILTCKESAENGSGVVLWCFALKHRPCGLEKVTSNLLRQHVVVALPGGGWEVVSVPGSQARELGVPVATACTATHLQTLSCYGGSKGLKTTGSGVQVGQHVGAGLELLWTGTALGVGDGGLHLLLVLGVHLHHRLSGEVESESGGQQWEKTELNHGVIQDLVLSRVVGHVVAVLELATYGTITGRNGDTASEDGAGHQDDGGADPGHGSVDESSVLWANELASVLVDRGVAGQHVDVWDLEVVEEEESVVHGVVSELWTDISNVDAVERLVGLEIADLHHEWVWAVGLAGEDELGHDNGMGGGAAEGANPPLGGSEVWRVNNKGLVGWIPGCGGLETADVGAVAKLGLCVTSNVLVSLCWLEEELLLLLGGLVLEGGL